MWFSARMIFECEVDDGAEDAPLQEESIRLIQAESETAALTSAEELGSERQHEYLNESGAVVRWRFVRVVEIQDLCESELSHGMEVYSRMFRKRKDGDRNGGEDDQRL